jgi:hypothetical protein
LGCPCSNSATSKYWLGSTNHKSWLTEL